MPFPLFCTPSCFVQLFKCVLPHVFEININLINTTVLHLTVNEVCCPVSRADSSHILGQIFFPVTLAKEVLCSLWST